MSFLDDFLMHIGVGWDKGAPGVGSSRFPHGSGDNPFQRAKDFYERDMHYRAKYPGMPPRFYAEKMGVVNVRGFNKGEVSVGLYTALRRDAESQVKMANRAKALQMLAEGKSKVEVAEILGVRDTTVGNWARGDSLKKAEEAKKTKDLIREFTDQYKYVDISNNSNNGFFVDGKPVGEGALRAAAESLVKYEGYNIYPIQYDLFGTDHKTTINVLAPPGVPYSEVSDNKFSVKNPVTVDIVRDLESGDIMSYGLKEKPQSVSLDRIEVEYSSPKDGLIELRPGVADISLGNKSYAQVRIGVDDTHYLKGMAVYNDDLPPGVDIRFNTSKKEGTPLMAPLDNPDAKQVFKPMKVLKDDDGKVIGVDWTNPFGASIQDKSEITTAAGQYKDENGEWKRSAINVVREEGEWMDWSASLASQYLSKQPVETARQQLNLRLAEKKVEFEEICKLENPTIKKYLLEKFADECDGNAVDLKAAPFKGQQTCVLLPCPDLPDNECYCPRYPDGTNVVLVRYPFANYAESPMLTVRNTGSPGQKVFPPTATDAIAINGRRLGQMSGADTDGDHCIVIPLSDKVKVKWSDRILPGLEGFDHKDIYAGYEGMKKDKHSVYQKKMGVVSNLITDMSFQDFKEEHLVRAIKFSMVIIDAEKSGLDWKRCYKEMGIDELRRIYQRDANEGKAGAGTIISRAKSPVEVKERKEWRIGPDTIDAEGNKIYTDTEKTYKKGKLDLSSVTLSNGLTVDLKHNNNEGYYYKQKDPSTKKTVKVPVSEQDLPPFLRGVKVDGAGWINMDTDEKTGKDYVISYNKVTRKSTRINVDDMATPVTNVSVKERMQEVPWMSKANDAYELVSKKRYPMEVVYANFANDIKELGRSARREWLRTGDQVKDPEAAKLYKSEVESLKKQLAKAESNAPFERSAQILAGGIFEVKKRENPDMTYEEKTKKKRTAYKRC